jgi:hypothetical protein
MRTHLSWAIIVVLATVCGPAGGQTAASQTGESAVAPETSKYLLLDSRIVERAENVRLTLGAVKKEAANPLFIEEKPWEPRFDNLYPNVMYDQQEHLYKCWYSPFIIDQAVTRTPPEKRKTLSYLDALHGNDRYAGVCYAFSKDGLTWDKPDLGIVEFDGSTKNNIVLRGVHGAGIFKDLRDPDPARRYKLFGKTGEDREPVGVAFSPDGLHWSKASPCSGIGAAGDTHNNSFWDDRLECYVAITRLFDGRQRTVGRSTSKDYAHWSKAEEVLHGNVHRQSYAMPVFCYANVYLGLLMILDTNTDLVDCELAWSPDGVKWERVCEGTPLIPRGPKGSFDYGCIYAAAYPIVRDGEIRLYYGGSNDTHGSWRKGGFGLARLRPDGFAGYEPADNSKSAIIVTKPIRCESDRLRVSADAAGGSLRVEVLDAKGASLGTSRTIRTDMSDALAEWDDTGLLSKLKGRTIQLKFDLKSAKLYSFRF